MSDEKNKEGLSEQPNKYLKKANDDLGSSNLNLAFTFRDYKDFLNFCEEISNSNLSPHKQASDVAIVVMAGHSLNISIATALSNIFPIKEKASLSNNLQAGLLIKGGVYFEIIKDAESIYACPVIEYDDEFNPKIKNDKPVVSEIIYKYKDELMADISNWETQCKNNYFDSPQEAKAFRPKYKPTPVGKGTIVKMVRMIKLSNGEYERMVVQREFTTMDADKITDKQGATVRQTKDAWQNYENDMLYANAFRRCAKVIGADLVLNLYSPNELLDNTDINYTIDDEGTVIINPKKDIAADNTSFEEVNS